MQSTGSPSFSAVLLAAGESRRMGGPNKLLLPVRGAPLVRRSLETLLACAPRELCVVLGHEASRVRAALEGAGGPSPGSVRLVVNDEFASGQVSSVRAGLSALRDRVDAVMICLADQPALTADDLRLLLTAFQQRPHGSFLVPTHEGARGNPVLLDWSSVREVLEQGTRVGCRHFMDRHAERVYRFEMPNDHVVRDLDFPADYAALSASEPS